jgi:hypothetical protein
VESRELLHLSVLASLTRLLLLPNPCVSDTFYRPLVLSLGPSPILALLDGARVGEHEHEDAEAWLRGVGGKGVMHRLKFELIKAGQVMAATERVKNKMEGVSGVSPGVASTPPRPNVRSKVRAAREPPKARDLDRGGGGGSSSSPKPSRYVREREAVQSGSEGGLGGASNIRKERAGMIEELMCLPTNSCSAAGTRKSGTSLLRHQRSPPLRPPHRPSPRRLPRASARRCVAHPPPTPQTPPPH